MKYYWMAVTADKYELPLAVAESSFCLECIKEQCWLVKQEADQERIQEER